MATSAGEGLPDPNECRGPAAEGRLYRDLTSDIWYECMLDTRTSEFVWAALPPSDEDPDTAES